MGFGKHLIIRGGSIHGLYRRKSAEQAEVLERIYQSMEEGKECQYQPDNTPFAASYYAQLGLTGELDLSELGVSERGMVTYPDNVIQYRELFHAVLSEDGDFLNALENSTISRDEYFELAEAVLRVAMEQSIGRHPADGKVPADVLLSSAPYYANRFRDAIAAYTGDKVEFLLDTLELDRSDEKALDRVRQACLGIELAAHYTAAMSYSPFRIDFLCATERSQVEIPVPGGYYLMLFEAGHTISRILIEPALKLLPHLIIDEEKLTEVLITEISHIAKLQTKRCLLNNLTGSDIIPSLSKDAEANYIPSALSRLNECYHRKDDDDNHESLSQEEWLEQQLEAEAIMRQQAENVRQQLEGEVGEEALEAGQTIIEYFKNITFDEMTPAQELDVSEYNDDDAGNQEEQEKETESSLEDYFLVAIGGQPRRKVKASMILQELQKGQTATFAKEKEMDAFLHAVKRKHPDATQGFQSHQLRFLEKGRIVRADQRRKHALQQHKHREKHNIAMEMHSEKMENEEAEERSWWGKVRGEKEGSKSRSGKKDKRDKRTSRRRERDEQQHIAMGKDIGKLVDSDSVTSTRQLDDGGQGKSTDRNR